MNTFNEHYYFVNDEENTCTDFAAVLVLFSSTSEFITNKLEESKT